MKTQSLFQSGFFRLRVLIGFVLIGGAVFLALLGFAIFPPAYAQPAKTFHYVEVDSNTAGIAFALPKVYAKAFDGDVRNLRPVPNKPSDRSWKEWLLFPPEPVEPEIMAPGQCQSVP